MRSVQFGAAVRMTGRWKNSEFPQKTQEPDTGESTLAADQAKTERAPELEVEQLDVLGHSRAAVSFKRHTRGRLN